MSVKKELLSHSQQLWKKSWKPLSLRHLLSRSVNTDGHNAIHKHSSFRSCDARPCTPLQRLFVFTESHFSDKMLEYAISHMWMYMCLIPNVTGNKLQYQTPCWFTPRAQSTIYFTVRCALRHKAFLRLHSNVACEIVWRFLAVKKISMHL